MGRSRGPIAMRLGTASGLQIVVLVFAVTLLAVPLTAYVEQLHGSLQRYSEFLGRFMPFALGAVLLLGIPGLRRLAAQQLATRIPPGKGIELAIVALAKLSLAAAAIGAMVLYNWIFLGPAALEFEMSGAPRADEQLAAAFSAPGIIFLLAATTLGPVMEEIIFRGFLYRAWEIRWGAFVSTVLVSTLFATYHTHFFAAFASSVVLVCVLRRTGSLRASIAVHAFYNAMLWYPLAGQFLMPPEGAALGDLAAWRLQLACLLFASIALPAYIWLARREYEPDPFSATPR